MKNTVPILFALLILLQSFSRVWVFVDFKINQDYIVKELCINRDKPEVLCSGKCVLSKNLKAAEEQEGNSLPQKSKEQKETTYYFEMLRWIIVDPEEVVAIKKSLTFYRPPRSSSFVMSIFHPPDALG